MALDSLDILCLIIPAKRNGSSIGKPFDILLFALAAERDLAGQKYILLRNNLVRFFEIRGFSSAEDLADEVINRLAKKLEGDGSLDNPQLYAVGIARMIVLETRKKPKEIDELPEICVDPEMLEEDGDEKKMECLERCLTQLPKENREIILGYYQGEKREKIEHRRKLAEKLAIPQNALRNRAVRLRNKLENCIKNCLRKISF